MPKLRFDLCRYADFDDPREVPMYTLPETGHYLQIPVSTLRSWVLGRDYPVEGGRRKRRFVPVISIPEPDMQPVLLSFFNIAEAHVLGAFRREHKLPLHFIRQALDYVSSRFGWERPLIEQRFKTDGVGLLVEQLGQLIDASARGQIVMKRIVEAHMRRLEWQGQLVARLYPFTRARVLKSPKSVLIDPRYSFGRPVLQKCHVATAVIAERYKAGDSVEILTEDYGCARLDIEEALRCELQLRTAA